MLDLHSDADHHRAVFTLAGAPGTLAEALQVGAREVIERIDLTRHDGVHPRVGAMDVAPVVYLTEATRGAACAEALVLADLLGELGLPVYLYGILAGGRTRAELRRDGGRQLARTKPDAGPRDRHPTAGAVLVAARPPLVAFNVELEAPATLEDARRIAARIREGGPDGLPGVRAIGLKLAEQDVVQVSTNLEDHTRTSPAAVVAAIAARCDVHGAELVALAPAAAFADFPAGVPLRGLRTIESALELLDS
ncbi:MAG: glutamate formiminotransferase [Solirubrobacterales bacterium]|nr:glutamate formiminotransferase [Solirubrobacterales bacterium]